MLDVEFHYRTAGRWASSRAKAMVAAASFLLLPRLVIKRKPPTLFDYRFEDFELLDYYAHGSIKAPIAV